MLEILFSVSTSKFREVSPFSVSQKIYGFNLLYHTDAGTTMLEFIKLTCINQQFGDDFIKQMNLQEILCTQTLHT